MRKFLIFAGVFILAGLAFMFGRSWPANQSMFEQSWPRLATPEGQAQIVPTKTDVSWLFKYAPTTNDIIWDKNFNNFIAAVTPSVVVDLGINPPGAPLKDSVAGVLSGPADFVRAEQDEGGLKLFFSACRVHSCAEKGLILLDYNGEKIVVGAIIHHGFNGVISEEPSILLFSKNVDANYIFSYYRKFIGEWLEREGLHVKIWRFVGADGQVQTL